MSNMQLQRIVKNVAAGVRYARPLNCGVERPLQKYPTARFWPMGAIVVEA